MNLFEYVKNDTIIYKIPAVLKLVLMLLLSIAVCFLDAQVNLIAFLLIFLVFVLSRVNVTYFLKDLLPIIWYTFFIVIFNILSCIISNGTLSMDEVLNNYTLSLISRLFTVVALTSLFFRTTSIFDLFYSLRGSLIIALFFNFFTRLFSIWGTLSKTYRARGGKRGVKMVYKLMPIFILLSLKKANDTYLSICNRKKSSV